MYTMCLFKCSRQMRSCIYLILIFSKLNICLIAPRRCAPQTDLFDPYTMCLLRYSTQMRPCIYFILIFFETEFLIRRNTKKTGILSSVIKSRFKKTAKVILCHHYAVCGISLVICAYKWKKEVSVDWRIPFYFPLNLNQMKDYFIFHTIRSIK
jgi:hypothetical protein